MFSIDKSYKKARNFTKEINVQYGLKKEKKMIRNVFRLLRDSTLPPLSNSNIACYEMLCNFC